jgi:lactate dehydrogenase-like 2-hydroxyacid dehydrogenase
VYQVFAIPAGTYVLACWIDVTEAEATNTTATVQLGDTSATAGFLTATAIATTGTYGGLYGGAEAYRALAGRMYGSDQTDADTAAERVISITVGTAAFTNAVIDVYALCCPMTY